MEKKKLPPLQVDVKQVKPLVFGQEYESRMILDHVITGRDDVIQINHGAVKAGYALGGAAHEEDEIYYILSGKGKLQLNDEIIEIAGLTAGDLLVIGCSSSEMVGQRIGKGSSMEAAHAAGCRFLLNRCRVPAVPADIVITSNGGYPLDQNVYQSVKGMTAAEAVLRDGGVIIICAACNDGHGGESFMKTMTQNLTPARILEQIQATPKKDTVPDQWESQILARILSRFHVILISQTDPNLVKAMKMHPAASLEEALDIAEHLLGRRGTITLIPEGISTIVV